jgi:hypothetical protein
MGLLLQSLDRHHLDVAKDAFSIVAASTSTIPGPFYLNNVIITPDIIQNL